MKCNVCGCEKFDDWWGPSRKKTDPPARKNVYCTQCGSVERTRLIWLYLTEKVKVHKDMKVLHIAPERGIHAAMSKILPPENYIKADLEPERCRHVPNVRQMDLTKLDQEPSCQYDLILHSHVLEHIPCNIAYTLFHLHRMLTPNGKHVCVIPFTHGNWEESFDELSDEERTKRYGQYDHVRRFGASDIDKHLGSLLNLPPAFDATKDFDEETLRDANVPENHWKGYHMGTLFVLNRDDMKFLNHPGAAPPRKRSIFNLFK